MNGGTKKQIAVKEGKKKRNPLDTEEGGKK